MHKMVCRIGGIFLMAITGYGATLSENLATVAELGNLTNAPNRALLF